MGNSWDFSTWGFFNLIAVLLASLMLAHMLKRMIPWLQKSLVPTSVLGGLLLLAISVVYNNVTGQELFDTDFFGNKGTAYLELLTYHTLALGFTASALKTTEGTMTKERTVEIFNTGITTVCTYLLQALVGMVICIIAHFFIEDLLEAAGILLAFGYGQGTGQAMNYGTIYETEYGFVGGKSFGLTVAAMGFLSASIGGVIHLNLLKRRGKILLDKGTLGEVEQVEGENEIPMQESIDKFTIQVALILVAYLVAYLMMYGLGVLVPGMKSTIYGFNFLLGVLSATLLKQIIRFCNKKNIIHRHYTNNFLLTRATNFFFDIMVAAGIILLREIDGDFKTPVADNLVFQNFPAMVFGFPILLLATMGPDQPYMTLGIIAVFFVVMNIVLFRSFIFKKKKAKVSN